MGVFFIDLTKNNRIFYIDGLRVFAIFCIIACHISAMFVVKPNLFNTKLWYYSLFLNSLRDVGVPLFVMISGALLINKKDSFKKFVTKRLKRVLIPYIFWIIIFILFVFFCISINYHFHHMSLNLLLYKIFASKPGDWKYFWFVPMILTVYLIIFILNKLNSYNKNTFKGFLILSILIILLKEVNLFNFNNQINLVRYLFFSIFAIFGYYLVNTDFLNFKLFKKFKINSRVMVFITGILIISLYACVLLTNVRLTNQFNKFNAISQFSILNILLVSSVMLFFRYIDESNILSNNYLIKGFKLKELILSISSCSYGIYLSHMIILLSLGYFLDPLLAIKPSVVLTLKLILTCIISWLLILILGKIHYLNKLIGKS